MSPRPVTTILAVVPFPYGEEGGLGHLHRQGVSWSEVVDICVGGKVDRSGWHDDPARGTRLWIVWRPFGGRRLRVRLKPLGDARDGVFMVLTAYDERRRS